MVHASVANPDWQVDFGLVASLSHLCFPQDVVRLGKMISDFPDVGVCIHFYSWENGEAQPQALLFHLPTTASAGRPTA